MHSRHDDISLLPSGHKTLQAWLSQVTVITLSHRTEPSQQHFWLIFCLLWERTAAMDCSGFLIWKSGVVPKADSGLAVYTWYTRVDKHQCELYTGWAQASLGMGFSSFSPLPSSSLHLTADWKTQSPQIQMKRQGLIKNLVSTQSHRTSEEKRCYIPVKHPFQSFWVANVNDAGSPTKTSESSKISPPQSMPNPRPNSSCPGCVVA